MNNHSFLSSNYQHWIVFSQSPVICWLAEGPFVNCTVTCVGCSGTRLHVEPANVK